jgi:hypothetical protein
MGFVVVRIPGDADPDGGGRLSRSLLAIWLIDQ